MRFGKDAARYGTAALDRISTENEQRPLIAVAVALGVGVYRDGDAPSRLAFRAAANQVLRCGT
jgi:hypothetical protein